MPEGREDLSGKIVFTKVDEHIYELDFGADYGLDELLKKGAGNALILALFVKRHFHLARPPVMKQGGFACTTFSFRDESGKVFMARNLDYRDSPCIIVRTAPETGYRSLAVADANIMFMGYRMRNPSSVSYTGQLCLAPYACMDGINEKGLSIAVLSLNARPVRQRRGNVPLITTVMIRSVLDRCADIEEAIRFFEEHDIRDSMGSSYHYQLTDRTGRSVILEYVGDRLNVTEGDENGLCCTNFYLTEGGDNSREMGRYRYEGVRKILDESGGIMKSEEAMNLLDRCKRCYRHKLGWQVTTCWSCVYNCTEAKMNICAGMDYEHVYSRNI